VPFDEEDANSDEDSNLEVLEPILSLPEETSKSVSRKRRFSSLSGETPADNTVDEYQDSARPPLYGIQQPPQWKYSPVVNPIHKMTRTRLTTNTDTLLGYSCASTCQPSKEDPQIQTQESSRLSTIMEHPSQLGMTAGQVDIRITTLTHRHSCDL